MIESFGERRSGDVGTDEDMSEGRGTDSSDSRSDVDNGTSASSGGPKSESKTSSGGRKSSGSEARKRAAKVPKKRST